MENLQEINSADGFLSFQPNPDSWLNPGAARDLNTATNRRSL
jgi:hypothetical protein